MKNFFLGGAGPVVIGGYNLPSPVGIGLTDPPNIGGATGPPGQPGPPGPPVPASLPHLSSCETV